MADSILLIAISNFVAERSLRVNNYWMRAEVQLNVVRDIAHELSEKHRMIDASH
jgi:hypothetical protein